MKNLIVFYVALILLLGTILLASGAVFVVRSGSMEPTIRAGDAIITRAPNGLISPGDIVTYQREDMLITHRVIEVLADGLRTQGDANNVPDPWIVPQGAVRRVFVQRVPYAGYLVAFLKTRQGWFAGVLLPAILFLIAEAASVVHQLYLTPDRHSELQ